VRGRPLEQLDVTAIRVDHLDDLRADDRTVFDHDHLVRAGPIPQGGQPPVHGLQPVDVQAEMAVRNIPQTRGSGVPLHLLELKELQRGVRTGNAKVDDLGAGPGQLPHPGGVGTADRPGGGLQTEAVASRTPG